MPFKVVEVWWIDAWVDTDEISIKEALKKKPILTVSVGQLIAENKHGVVMVTDAYPKYPKRGKITNLIPWEMVTDYYSYEDV